MGKIVIMMVLILCPLTVFGSSNFKDVTVKHAGVLGNGDVLIKLSVTSDEIDCKTNFVKVENLSAAKDSVLSVALIAYTTGTMITVKTSGCYGGHPTIDDNNSWFVLNEK